MQGREALGVRRNYRIGCKIDFRNTFCFGFLAHFLPIFEKNEFLGRKVQKFCIVFSMVYKKCEKKVKIYSKIGLTCAVGLCIILGTPTRCSPKGWAAPREQAKQGRARQFSSLQTFWGAEAELRNSLPDTTFRVGRRRGKREGRKRSWRVPWPAPRWSSAELRSEVTRYWWIWKMVHWSSNF